MDGAVQKARGRKRRIRVAARLALGARRLRQWRRRRTVSLALQGGGSFGAFTWGVLEGLLQDDRIAFDAVSGASAGAINAVVMAHGLAQGGPAEACEALERFWRRASSAASLAPLGSFARVAGGSAALEMSARVVSPYQFNPLGLNPLRDILAAEIDFARLRRSSPVRLFIAATRVRDGALRIFREHEITLDAVLASACLPHLHHAVEIEGEWYWDGGLSANPPLRQLAFEAEARDLLIVQIIPDAGEDVPRLSANIARRLGQISFSAPLQNEIDTLAELTAFCRVAGPFRPRFCRKLEKLRLHRIAADDKIARLDQASAFDLRWGFLGRLRERGFDAAEDWLDDFFAARR